MKLVPIESHANPLLKKVRSLNQRSKRQRLALFLLEGAKLLNEALDKGVGIEAIIASQSFFKEGLPGTDQSNFDSIFIVEDKLFLELNTTATSCGIVAVARIKPSSIDQVLIDNQTLFVIGDAIQDPGNTGTIIRTAAAFGASAVILTKGSVDPYSPKVVRSAMGALFSIPIIFDLEVNEVISHLAAFKIKLVALEPSAQTVLSQIKQETPIAYAFGNEGHGLSQSLLASADFVVQIPIKSTTESLNVAVCAGIVLFSHAQHVNLGLQKLN
jgi:TrmH family RNA methyltransferase